MLRLRLALTAALAASLPSLTGCLTMGQSKVLGFDYKANDQIFGRRTITAIAVGGYVDLQVSARRPDAAQLPLQPNGPSGEHYEADRDKFQPINVRDATSSIPTVAMIDIIRGPLVRVRGFSAGTALITVETELGNDTVPLEVAEPAASTVEHWTWPLIGGEDPAKQTAFLVSGTGRFLITMRDASGRTVVGSDIPAPLAVSPPGAAALESIFDGELGHIDVHFHQTGPLSLIGSTRSSVDAIVIAPEDVTALKLVALDKKISKIEEPSSFPRGEERIIGVQGDLRDGRRVLLLGGVVRAASATPDVCPAPDDLNFEVQRLFGDGVTAVHGAAEGPCTIEAKLGELRATVTVTVEAKKEEPRKEEPRKE